MIDDDKFNRAIWAYAKGDNVPYPVHLAGAHGKGLKSLGLELALNGLDEDEF